MKQDTRALLEDLRAGRISVDEALLRLKTKPFEDIGFAKPDTHRGLRQGAGEVIYGEGKTAEQIIAIVDRLLASGQSRLLITRLSPEKAAVLAQSHSITYHENPRLAVIGGTAAEAVGNIVVACAGTSDLYCAEEAALVAEHYGNRVTRLYDVGVSGLHRLLAHLDDIMRARVIVAVAGMEGALASVIGGLADCPVIAVPTSVGYGASFQGVAALLSMLNACASGCSVVNIDNGFGAGYLASMINHIGE